MADSKKQAAGTRVATPKVGTQGLPELDLALSKAIGARVKLTTTFPTIALEGTIFTACPITNIIALNTASANGAAQSNDYHLISVSNIQSFTVIALPDPVARNEGLPSSFDGALPSISRLDLKSLKSREFAAIRKMKEKDALRGKGVGKDAQDIFDAVNRTLPARWDGTSIIVNDAVIVAPPYKPEDCTAPKDQQNALARVKKVLENERRKLADRASKPVLPPPGVMRKGG